jgi:hypothetical protein
MSILDRAIKANLDRFPGAQQYTSEAHRAASRITAGAIISRNNMFRHGQVRTRNGFGQAQNMNRIVNFLTSWQQGSSVFNYLIHLENYTNLRALDLRGILTEKDLLLSLSGVRGLTTAQAGSRIYFAFADVNGLGTEHAYVWDGLNTNGTEHMDKCFSPPLRDTTDVSVSSATTAVPEGKVPLSGGDHNVGFLILTRSGFLTRPCPSNSSGSSIVPHEITATGSDAYNITLTPNGNWPDWALQAWIIMTPVDNSEDYRIVSGAVGNIGGGGAVPVVITVADSDNTIRGDNSAVKYFDMISQTPAGAAPFEPFLVVEGSNHMCYFTEINSDFGGTQSAVYVSDSGNYQNMRTAQNLLQLPGFRSMRSGVWIGNAFHVMGPQYTYFWRSTGQEPVYWGDPERIDGRIGTRWIDGVTHDPSRGYAWVAAQDGLYNYAGTAYTHMPISYYQGASDWDRINNAAAPSTLKVRESPKRHMVAVFAPLDAATECSHVMVWDWSEAGTPEGSIDPLKVKYSLWDITSFEFGGADFVLDDTSREWELWVGRATASGDILRLKNDDDSNLYQDDVKAVAQGIDAPYQSPPLVYSRDAWLDIIAASISLRGSGVIEVRCRGTDDRVEHLMESIRATLTPGEPYLRWVEMQANSASIYVTNGGTVGSYYILDLLRLYYVKILEHAGVVADPF